MNENEAHQNPQAPLGDIEPHAHLLKVPSDDQLLYKIMSIGNLLRSIIGNYLHFNRVDSYADFPGADRHDGQQLPKDQEDNVRARFEKAPDFSAADYYDRSRSRTYACCFSLENSDCIWENYARDSAKGKVCVVFTFGRLREMINRILRPGNAALEYEGNQCVQIFSVNYGIVEYIERESHKANVRYFSNPIEYIYLKDRKYAEEKELRVSLSAFGMGHVVLKDGKKIQFPPNLQLDFNFRTAIADQTIQQILFGPNCDFNFLQAELHKFRIVPKKK